MPHLDVYIDIEWSENVNTHPNCVCAYLTNIGGQHNVLAMSPPLLFAPPLSLECDPLHHWKAATLSLSITWPSIFWPTLAVCWILLFFAEDPSIIIFTENL